MKCCAILLLLAVGDLTASAEPDINSLLSAFSDNFHELKTIEFKCEGRGKGYAHDSVQYSADLLTYKVDEKFFSYSYQDSFLLTPEGSPKWEAQRTVAYDGEILQIMLHPEALLQITKKSGVEARNFDYGRTKNQGLFEPYAIMALVYHAEMVQAKDPGHLKLASPFSQGYYPLMADYLAAAKMLKKRTGAFGKITYSEVDSEKYSLVAQDVPFGGRSNTLRVFFQHSTPEIPYRWELISDGNFHPHLVWEGDTLSLKRESGFSYYGRHTKKTFSNIQQEKDKPRLDSEHEYKISECRINNLLDDSNFIIDPTAADLILDIDEDRWIKVPR